MSDILNFVKRDLKFHIDAVKENYRLPPLQAYRHSGFLRRTGFGKNNNAYIFRNADT